MINMIILITLLAIAAAAMLAAVIGHIIALKESERQQTKTAKAKKNLPLTQAQMDLVDLLERRLADDPADMWLTRTLSLDAVNLESLDKTIPVRIESTTAAIAPTYDSIVIFD